MRPSEIFGRLLAVLRAHPRHLIVGGAVAGLVLGPRWAPGALLAAAALAAVAGRPPVALLAAATTLTGAMLADARLDALDRTDLRPLIGRTVALDAVLLEQPRKTAAGGGAANGAGGRGGWAAGGGLASGVGGGGADAAPAVRRRGGGRKALAKIAGGAGSGERILVRAGGELRWPFVETGGVVRISGRLEALGPWDSYQRRRGAHAVLRASRAWPTGRRRGGVAGALDHVRARAEHALSAGPGPKEAALLRGMVLGQDEQLSEPVRDEFRRSGLAHLLAASGQNIVLLAALALPILRSLGLGLRARLLGVLLLIVAYVPLAGAGPSIQRAGVMGAAGVVAGLAGRPASRWYAVLLAALTTLAVNPRAVEDPGWQLSFAAVLAILALASPLRAALGPPATEGGEVEGAGAAGSEGSGGEGAGRGFDGSGKQGAAAGPRRRLGLPRPIAEAAALTIAATLGTAPLIVLHFERLSLVSLPANLLAAPAVAPIMWLGMLSAAAGQVATAPATLLDALASYPLGYLAWVAHATSGLPNAELPVRLPGAWGLAVAYAALGAVCGSFASSRARRAARRLARRPGGQAALAGMAVLLLAALVLWPRAAPVAPPAGFRVSFLAIGQGDATLLQHGSRAILVDTGPPEGPLLKRLEEAGIGRLDALVVTHDQADHAGGAAAVLDAIPVGTLVDGGEGPPSPQRRAFLAAAARRGVRRIVPSAGQAIRAGPLRLDVLWPRRSDPFQSSADPNDRALVVLARDGPVDALLPADAESNVTATLDLPPVEVLKVAHHGSEDPGLASILARLRPRIAVIPVGTNTYGHPTAQALGALRTVGQTYRTDRDGTVRIDAVGASLAVTTARRNEP
ncbi:MAG: ComEC/Rec2 family competence protein [Solirubrobacteraceae bacterium]